MAVSNHRIINLEKDKVRFSYKDYADKGKTKTMVPDACEFIRRFLLHVLPKKFVKIRYYGLFGFKDRKAKIDLCRSLLGSDEKYCREDEIPEGFKELYEFVTGNEIDRCPYCKKGKLIYVHDIFPRATARGP